MGLDFSTLLNAALGGTAAYQSGRRTRADNEEKKAATVAALARQAEIDADNRAVRDAQVSNYQSEAARRQDEIDHPEKYRTPRSQTSEEAYTTYFDGLVASGKTPVQADAEARRRFGKVQEHPYVDPLESHKANRLFDINHPLPTRAGGGNPGTPRPLTEAQRAREAEKFASRMVEQSRGDPRKAVAYVEGNPSLKEQAINLGLTESHYNAAAFAPNRRKTYKGASEALSQSIPATPQASAAPKAKSQQQSDYDAAASALRARGEKNPTSILGPRPG